MDDFENFIRHSDFGKILELASTLKDQKSRLVTIARGQQGPRGASAPSLSLRSRKKKKSGPGEYQIGAAFGTGREERPQSRMDVNHHTNSFDSAAELIRASLIPSAEEGSDPMVDLMGRGECLITDSLIDETIKSLADELKLCLDLKKQLRVSRQGSRISEASSGDGHGMNYGDTKQVNWKMENGGGDEGEDVHGKVNPIAKFSKWQTDILTDWMIENREHPFPTQDQIRGLSKATNLSDTQVVNWTTNVRKRNLKATVDGEKKPHHFLDYLFLATDREKKMRREHSDMDFSFLDNVATESFSGYPDPRAQTLQHGRGRPSLLTQPPLGYAPPRFNHQHYAQPDIHHRHTVAPPRAPRNTDQIFRRGKRLSDLKEQGHHSKKAEWPTSQFALAQNDAQLQKERQQLLEARERERMVLRDYAPNGMPDTPPGSFDEHEGRLFMDDIDEDMFDEQNVTTGARGLNSLPNGVSDEGDMRQRKTVSFEMADVPFDENAEDYLMRLIAG